MRGARKHSTIVGFWITLGAGAVAIGATTIAVASEHFVTARSRTAIGVPVVFLVNADALAQERVAYAHNDPATVAKVEPLIARATRDLAVTPVSVMAKSQLPPSGSKHDYMSLSIYAWPNPDTRSQLPYVIRDGQKNPEVTTVPDKQNLANVIDWTQELSYAYYFTGDDAYASKASKILSTWFLDPATKMGPSLTYAQAVKGVSTGQAGGIIDTADLPEVVDAAGLLAGSRSWTATKAGGLRSWFAEYLTWLRTSPEGVTEASAPNNHATWYATQVLSYSLFVGDSKLASRVATESKTSIIARQIQADGSQPAELKRADSWSYSTYNVYAFTRLAQLAQAASVDLWNYQAPNRASIRQALDFVAAYDNRLPDWPYPQSRPRTLEYMPLPLYAAASAYQLPQYAAAGRAAAASLPASYPSAAVLFPPS